MSGSKQVAATAAVAMLFSNGSRAQPDPIANSDHGAHRDKSEGYRHYSVFTKGVLVDGCDDVL